MHLPSSVRGARISHTRHIRRGPRGGQQPQVVRMAMKFRTNTIIAKTIGRPIFQVWLCNFGQLGVDMHHSTMPGIVIVRKFVVRPCQVDRSFTTLDEVSSSHTTLFSFRSALVTPILEGTTEDKHSGESFGTGVISGRGEGGGSTETVRHTSFASGASKSK